MNILALDLKSMIFTLKVIRVNFIEFSQSKRAFLKPMRGFVRQIE